MLLLATACGVPSDDKPRPIPDDRVPFGLLDVEPAPGLATATVFMVAGDRLYPATRNVPAPLSPDKLFQALLAGVVPEEASRNIRSAIAPAVRGSVAEAVGGRLHVDLSAAFPTSTTTEHALAVAQIVYTLTSLPGVDSVTFSVLGRPVEVPAGDGTVRSGAVGRADFGSVAKL